MSHRTPFTVSDLLMAFSTSRHAWLNVGALWPTVPFLTSGGHSRAIRCARSRKSVSAGCSADGAKNSLSFSPARGGVRVRCKKLSSFVSNSSLLGWVLFSDRTAVEGGIWLPVSMARFPSCGGNSSLFWRDALSSVAWWSFLPWSSPARRASGFIPVVNFSLYRNTLGNVPVLSVSLSFSLL